VKGIANDYCTVFSFRCETRTVQQ